MLRSRHSPRLALLLLLVVSSACLATNSRGRQFEQARFSLEGIADNLVRSAAQRTDIRLVRACLQAFREDQLASPETGPRPTRNNGPVDLVGAELEREFVLALANRLHVIEPGFTEPGKRHGSGEEFARIAAAQDASHLIVGDYYEREDELVLSVRLINVETHLILAAARGVLPLDILSQAARDQLEGKVVEPPLDFSSGSIAERRKERRLYTGDPAGLALPPPERVETPLREEIVIPPGESSFGPEAEADAAPPKVFEDFETWRKRRMSEDLPPDKPWRTSTLAELLKIPPTAKEGEGSKPERDQGP